MNLVWIEGSFEACLYYAGLLVLGRPHVGLVFTVFKVFVEGTGLLISAGLKLVSRFVMLDLCLTGLRQVWRFVLGFCNWYMLVV